MSDFQLRAINEKEELDVKIKALSDFFNNKIFSTLPTDEKVRLSKQLLIMTDYSAILSERIAHFS